MPKVRSSVKARKGAKKGWPSKTRSYAWRKGETRPTEALKGLKVSVTKPPTAHRFTRWGPTFNMINYDIGGGITGFKIVGDDTPASPLFLGTPAADGAGVSQWQIGGAFEFALPDVSAYTDFTSLFDQYSIEQVDIEFDDVHNTSIGGAGISSLPQICYVPDFDDSAIPGNARAVSEYQRAKVWTFRGDGKPLKVSVQPRVAVPIYNGISAPGYATGTAGMLYNVTTPTMPFYGMKLWFRNLTSGPTIAEGQTNIRFKVKYHLKFNDPK
jgi:hypothetical protein